MYKAATGGHTQSPVQLAGLCLHADNLQEHQANLSSSSIAKFMNAWSHSSTPVRVHVAVLN
jgi:hypothetical protein